MNEKAIRKIRHRFMKVSFLAFFLTMVLIAGLLWATNFLLNRRIARSTLEYIVNNEGHLQGYEDQKVNEYFEDDGNYYSINRFLNDIFNNTDETDEASINYTTRYFAILYDKDKNMTDVVTNQVGSISNTEAENYGRKALNGNEIFGRSGAYYYQVGELKSGGYIVVYLDCSSMIENINRIMYLALCLIMFGVVVAAFIIRIFSAKVASEEVKNIKLQRRFITNASHELKTPLAVIRANTEMEEILSGESEWTQSTLRQVERMSGLIQNLVMISRSDEGSIAEDAGECDVSKAVSETSKTFSPVAIQDRKTITDKIQENVVMLASDSQIRQLTSLLIDNAIKYCDENGNIGVEMYEKGKYVHLIVSNNYKKGEKVDYSRFFERFYREDESHNTDKGGYGIGLSIAQGLVEQYHGTIHVNWKDGVIYFHCTLRSLKL